MPPTGAKLLYQNEKVHPVPYIIGQSTYHCSVVAIYARVIKGLISVPRDTSNHLHTQELIRRWDSERELLRSAPRKLPEFAEITQNNGD